MKNILLIITVALLPILLYSQEKISFKNSKSNSIEFEISGNTFFVKYQSDMKQSIKSKVKEYVDIFENKALVTTNMKYTKFEENVKALKSNLNENEIEIIPVLIYKDGVKQVCNNEISIKLKNNFSLDKLFSDYEYTAVSDKFTENQYLIKFENADNRKIFDLVNKLQNHPEIEYIEPNFIRFLNPFTNDPYYYSQWSIYNQGYLGGTSDADMDVDDAWQLSTGQGVKVAIIDEGVDLTHPDLTANLLPGYDATGNGSNGAPSNNDAHGTSCAGIVAAVANNNIGIAGIAYNSKIIPIRIAYKSGKDWITNDSWIASGINWAVQNGADILSNSWAEEVLLKQLQML